MQLTAIFLLGICLQVTASAVSQTVTFSGRDVPLEKVLSAVEQQTGYMVVYGAAELRSAQPVTISANQLPLEKFLQQTLEGQLLTYSIEEKTIFIRKNKAGDLSTLLISPPPPITVRGRILNEKGEPVIASIIIKGTKRGTTSDVEGFFTLNNVDDNAELIISATNIETVTTYVNAKESLNITVKMTSSSLSEVIVNKGYYSEKQRLSTGNVARVDAKDIENQPVTSPLLALQGRMPGVEITPTSGTPGSAPTIQIRGLNSLRLGGNIGGVTNGNLPLYIIDGIPINSTPILSGGGTLMGSYDPLSTINPSNIENIQILKDADATAIYGSRGANGVVLITTRNKKSVQGLNTDANFYRGMGEVVTRMKMLSKEEYLTMRHEAIQNDGPGAIQYYEDPLWGPYLYPDLLFWDTTRNTDWQNEILGHQSNITDMRLNVSAGTGRTTFGIGGSYHKETLLFPGDYGYSRYSGNLSLNHSSVDGKFNLAIATNYGVDNHKLFNNDLLLSSALSLPPIAPEPYNEDGTLNWKPNFGSSTWANPWTNLKTTNVASANNLITNASLSYDLTNGFTINARLGFSRYDQKETINIPISSLSPYGFGPFEGKSQITANQRSSWSIEPHLNYKKQFGDHAINSLIGLSLQETKADIQSLTGIGYTSDALLETLAGAARIQSADNSSEYRYIAGFIRFGYDYKGKYILNLTGRRDGSSRFGPANRFSNFGAVGLGWIFSEENLFKNRSWVFSFGKIRASYGVTGNDQIGDSKFLKTYQPTFATYHGFRGLAPSAPFNPDYAWERTRKGEAAIELGFFNNKVSVMIASFRNRSSNQLVQYPLPSTTGFSNVLTNFDAIIENTGWEYSINTKNIDTKKFTWISTFNISVLKNKLVKFDGIENSPYVSTFKVGEPLSLIYGYKWLGVDPLTGIHTFEDINKDGTITAGEDQILLKPLISKFFGGIGNTFSYGGFTLDFFLQISDRNAQVFYDGIPGGMNNQPKDILDRWQKTGDITNIQRFTNGDPIVVEAYQRFTRSDGDIQRISFLRLKTLSFLYAAPSSFVNKIGIKGAKLFIQGQNLFTITDFEGWDPETIYGVPALRILSGGVQIKL